jgi:hypothetical protein
MSVYLAVMMPAVCFAVLFTASAWQITKRFDLSLVFFAVFAMLGVSAWRGDWLLYWAMPALSYISDAFGNNRRLASVAYNRLFWALALSGLWAASFLCVRRYGKNMAGSAVVNLKKAYIPLIAAALLFSGGFAYAAQPFLDGSPELADGYGFYFSGAESEIICKSIHVDARPDMSSGRFYADAAFNIENAAVGAQTVSFKINPGYKVVYATANGAPAAFRDLADDDMNQKTVEIDLPPDTDVELTLGYGGYPTEWNIVGLMQGQAEISRDYIYLANADFSPDPEGALLDPESFAFTAA